MSPSADDEGPFPTYRLTGGLDARGFRAPLLRVNERLSSVSDLLRFLEEVEEDRECETKPEGPVLTTGEEVPSLMMLGLEDESVL